MDPLRSRQKNCNSCVQAKRRCDRRLPICSRCAKQRIDCLYGKGVSTIRTSAKVPEQPVSYSQSLEIEGLAYTPFAMDQADSRNFLENTLGEPQPDAAITMSDPMQDFQAEVSVGDDIPIDPFLEMMGDSITTMPPIQDQWLVSLEQNSLAKRALSPADDEVTMSSKEMDDTCEAMEPWHIYDSRTPLYHIVNCLKSFTTDAATRNATPFLHRHLYRGRIPKCILACFTTNVLYTNRTLDNTAMVIRAIHDNVKELIHTEVQRTIVTPAQKLARTQSLFLYQIIRLLDGDVMLRTQGEKDMSLLQNWLDELCSIRENLGEVVRLENSARRKQPAVKWEDWIFAESMRRTIIIAYSFIALYEMMKDTVNDDDLGPWAYAHRWTLSQYLWAADSPYEFTRMWSQKPHFIITNYSFKRFLEYGSPDDVDEFAEILLSVYLGVDATKEFLSSRSSNK